MAPRKNGRTSKTAHVLSLLTNVTEAPTFESEPQEPIHTLLPPVLEQTRTRDDSAAQSIRLALEQELEKELETKPEAQSAPPAYPEEAMAEDAGTPESLPAEPEPEPVPEPLAEAEPEPEAESTPETEPEPVSAAAEAPEPEAAPAEELAMVNVMERLVEKAAGKYMKLFGVCSCPRCRLDVQALALENLPPKYVVSSKALESSLSFFYEDTYRSAIVAQLTRACREVMEHPHHRDGD